MKNIELEMMDIYAQAEKDLDTAIYNAIEALRDDVKEVLNSEIINDFVFGLETDKPYMPKDYDPKSYHRQVGVINDLAKSFGLSLAPIGQNFCTASANISSQATRSFIKIPGNSNALRTIDAIGSPLHKNILALGKTLGIKFKPFQAAGIAKNLGNAANIAGKAAKFLPLFGFIAAVGFEIKENHEQQRQARQLREVQGEIEHQFCNIASNVEQQIIEQIKQFGEFIDMEICQERKNYDQQKNFDIEYLKKIGEVKNQFNDLIDEIRDLRY